MWAHLHDLDRGWNFRTHLPVEHSIKLILEWNWHHQHGHEKRQTFERASRRDSGLLRESSRYNGPIVRNDRFLRSNFWSIAHRCVARAAHEDLAEPEWYNCLDSRVGLWEEIDAQFEQAEEFEFDSNEHVQVCEGTNGSLSASNRRKSWYLSQVTPYLRR